MQKDSAGLWGRTSYTAVGDRVKTNAQGEAALGELAIDEVLDMEPTTDGKGMVLTVPYRVVTQSLPSGMVKPDPTQITVDTRTLNATQAVEIAVRGDTVARISGNNRYQTEVKNAEEAFPEGVQAKDGYDDVLVGTAWRVSRRVGRRSGGFVQAGFVDGKGPSVFETRILFKI